MIVIDEIEYESYYDLCKAYNISFAELIKYRMKHKDISEWDLLSHFINDLCFVLNIGEYLIMPKETDNEKLRNQNKEQ